MAMVNKRTVEVLVFIYDCVQEHGCPPSIREIRSQMGMTSTNGPRFHIDRLIKAGYLVKRGPGLSRSLMLTEAGVWLARDAKA